MRDLRLSIAQLDVAFGDFAANLRTLTETMDSLAGQTDLVVFPEAFLTGYVVDTKEECAAIAIGDQEIAQVQEVVERTKTACIVGYTEIENGTLYNTAAIIFPGQSIVKYRKTHIPWMGIDNHVEPGDWIEPIETPFGKIGVLICFDLRAPEATRTLMLKGADILILPTNWPVGADLTALHIAPARAAENRMYVAVCNRAGTEKGFEFIGQSGLYDITGATIEKLDREPGIFTRAIDLSLARDKHIVNIPGKYELHITESRRPELYGVIPKND